MKKLSMLLTLFFVCLSVQKINAQMISADTIKAQLVKDWERAKSYTDEYLTTMPADKYGARAVDSIRSFAEQMLHLAAGTIGLVNNGTGAVRIFPGFNMEKSAGAQNKDSVTYYVNASYDYAINSIKNMDAAKLGDHVKRGTFDETKLTWLMKAFEHQTHHRGQCTIYIRLQGIRPPNERLF
ncbi:MAG: DinB family protein [Sediminibacterium sp.]